MSDIQHKIQIQRDAGSIYEALSTIDGLASWWTTTTSGDSSVGDRISFRFGDHVTEMEVEESSPNERVSWICTASVPDWEGTRVTFDLAEQDGSTLLRFRHRDWAEASDFFSHCNMKWGVFLLSLKRQLENGEGWPFPNEPKT